MRKCGRRGPGVVNYRRGRPHNLADLMTQGPSPIIAAEPGLRARFCRNALQTPHARSSTQVYDRRESPADRRAARRRASSYAVLPIRTGECGVASNPGVFVARLSHGGNVAVCLGKPPASSSRLLRAVRAE